jgi:16S rRNA processing protein RimM
MAASPDAPRPGLLEVGRVARSHGLRGEVLVELTSDRPERTEPGAVLVTDDGELTVVEARPHQRRWLVRFAGVDRREDADALRGSVLWGEPIEDEETVWVHDLIGATVLDRGGVRRGVVVAVVANPASDLLELDSGALVPSTFLEGPPVDGVVRVDTPEGLFDL